MSAATLSLIGKLNHKIIYNIVLFEENKTYISSE